MQRSLRLACLLACAMVAATLVSLGPTAAAAAPAVSTCPGGGSDAGFTLSTTTFDPTFTRHPFVGNGYLGQRVPPTGMGYVATGEKTGWPLFTPRYDGAFVTGLYGQDPKLVEGRQVIAAIPTWSTLTVGTGAETYTATTPAARISNYQQALLMRCGLLSTSLTWTTGDGRSTDLAYDILADQVHPHVGVVRLRLTPHWNGQATVTDVIDGAGARRLVQSGGGARGDATVDVAFATQTTAVAGAVASTLVPGQGVSGAQRRVRGGKLTASQALTFTVDAGRTYELVKFVGADTALTSAQPETAAVSASQTAAAQGWPSVLSGHAAAWADLWRSDVVLPDRPDLQAWIRSGLYGLASNIRQGGDTSISPVGLTSDNYAGLIFWDAETWMFPGLLLLHPEVAESVLEYRFRTLPGARANARQLGFQGVFYPWNSASNGDLATECHSVDPPHCITQIHLQGDIALAAWQFFLATGDAAWLRSRGWPMLQGIAQFWAGRVTSNRDGSFSIDNVAGPDEFSNGVNDGVYTNAVAAAALRNATQAARILGEPAPARWTTVADNLRLPFDRQRQVFLQYDGYNGSLIKQADTVLLIYPLELPMPAQVAASTLDFYAERTDPDGPAMTDSIHAIDAAEIGEPGCATHTYLMRSVDPFIREPFAQFVEARGDKAGSLDPLAGAPAFNFLTGHGGFAQVFTNGLTGLRWRGRTFDISVGPDETTVSQRAGQPFTVESPQGTQVVSTGSPASLKTRRPDLAPTDNVARCRPAQVSSQELGMLPEGAVDGSAATLWAPAPTAPGGSLRVDLGKRLPISRITVRWTDALPGTFQVLVSDDGTNWTPAPPAGPDGTLQHPVNARHVRVDLTRPAGGERVGIRELEVIRR
jgi:trehalose/maltose hydrolase-like predicted phosphorylase